MFRIWLETVAGLVVLALAAAVVGFTLILGPYLLTVLLTLLVARYLGRAIVTGVEGWGGLTDEDDPVTTKPAPRFLTRVELDEALDRLDAEARRA